MPIRNTKVPQGVDMQLINEEGSVCSAYCNKRTFLVMEICSGAPWVRKCGNLPIREILVMT